LEIRSLSENEKYLSEVIDLHKKIVQHLDLRLGVQYEKQNIKILHNKSCK